MQFRATRWHDNGHLQSYSVWSGVYCIWMILQTWGSSVIRVTWEAQGWSCHGWCQGQCQGLPWSIMHAPAAVTCHLSPVEARVCVCVCVCASVTVSLSVGVRTGCGSSGCHNVLILSDISPMETWLIHPSITFYSSVPSSTLRFVSVSASVLVASDRHWNQSCILSTAPPPYSRTHT